MEQDTNERREACRKALLHFLALRPLLKFNNRDATAGMNREGKRTGDTCDWTETEVSAAGIMLAGLGLISRAAGPLGGVTYLQITAAGTLEDERE